MDLIAVLFVGYCLARVLLFACGIRTAQRDEARVQEWIKFVRWRTGRAPAEWEIWDARRWPSQLPRRPWYERWSDH